jgi:hypothetical protein
MGTIHPDRAPVPDRVLTAVRDLDLTAAAVMTIITVANRQRSSELASVCQ